jgi:hypothetical protein
MEQTSVTSPGNYELRRSGGDGIFGDGDDVILEIALDYAFGSFQAELTWGGALLPSDTYRLTVYGGEAAFLVDLAGNKLDGDTDGDAGGNYVRTFLVDYDAPLADHVVPSGAVAVGPTSLDVVFDENDRLDAATAEDKASYTLIHSGGDDSFGSGDVDVSAWIEAVSYDAGTMTATLHLTAPLPAERYRLTVSGTAIRDETGNLLNGGADQSFELLVDGIAPASTLLEPAPGALTNADLGYVEVLWDDADGVGIDPASIDPGDVLITGVTVDAVEAVAGGWRYTYDTVGSPDALGEGAVTVTFVAGQVLDLAGNANPGGAAQFSYDATGPRVVGVSPVVHDQRVVSILIEFDEALDAATAEQLANYALWASGGDGAFDDGNEIDLSGRLASGVYTGQTKFNVFLGLTPGLGDEAYRLIVRGAGGVADPAGNWLNDGDDEVRDLIADNTAASVAISLHPDDDTAAPGDGITAATNLRFRVSVNEAGRIELDYDDDGEYDETLVVGEAGTYTFGPRTFGEAAHTVRARLTDTAGGAVADSVELTVDVTGPTVEGVSPAAEAITVTFSESLDAGSAADAGNYVLIHAGPNGELEGGAGDDVTVAVTPAYVAGELAVTLTTTGGFAEGLYELTVRGTATVTDPAGNALNDGLADHVEQFEYYQSGPIVVATDPQQDQPVAALPAWIEVAFSEAIDPDTVQAGDLVLGGSAVVYTNVTSVTQVDARTYRFDICPTCGTQWQPGTVEASVGAGAVATPGGRGSEPYSWSFAFDDVPPTVLSLVMNDAGEPPHTMVSLAATFSEAVSVSAAALVLYDETAAAPIDLSGAGFEYDAPARTARWDLSAAAVPYGHRCTATLDSSRIADGMSHALDGDADGFAGGNYTKSFLVAMPGDADLNARVDELDYLTLKRNVGTGSTWAQGDFDDDGDVDFHDFQALKRNFGWSFSGGAEVLAGDGTPASDSSAGDPAPDRQPVAEAPAVEAPAAAEPLPPAAPAGELLSVAASADEAAPAAGDRPAEPQGHETVRLLVQPVRRDLLRPAPRAGASEWADVLSAAAPQAGVSLDGAGGAGSSAPLGASVLPEVLPEAPLSLLRQPVLIELCLRAR